MDFWISDWISGFHSGFLDFTVDFWISQWISGFQLGFLDFWISVWISADGVRDFFRDGPLAPVLLADNHVAKGVLTFFQFFSPHSSAHIAESCSCTRLVSAYIVALFQCFRMVPVS